MENLQEGALCRVILKAPRLIVSPVVGGHVNLHRILAGFLIQLHLIGDLLPRVLDQCSLQKGEACTYKINIDVIMVGTDGDIGEHHRMGCVLQLPDSK